MRAIQDLAHRKTIMLIAHRVRTVRHRDAICLLERGRAAARGTYDELMASSGQFRPMAAGRPARPFSPGEPGQAADSRYWLRGRRKAC